MQEIIIIIPCYNESQRLDKVAFNDFLKNNEKVHLFFVNDGSTDNTFSILNKFSQNYSNAISFHLNKNSGKAEAIRQSIIEIIKNYNFKYIGYFDADLSTSLSYINIFYNEICQKENIKAITGARIRRLGTNISRNQIRHFFGRIVATIASSILSLPVYDTQCGAKIFEASFIKNVFTYPFKTKWLFDIEIFVRLIKTHGRNIVSQSILEFPLNEWIDEGDSRIKLIDFIRVPFDLFKILKESKR